MARAIVHGIWNLWVGYGSNKDMYDQMYFSTYFEPIDLFVNGKHYVLRGIEVITRYSLNDH